MTPAEQTALDTLTSAYNDLRVRCEQLEQQLEWFKRQTYGSKSERFVPGNLQTSLSLDVPTNEIPVQLQTIEAHTRTKTGKAAPHGREDLPAHLPRRETVLLPGFDTTGMEKIGEKVTEELEYVPPSFFVNRIVRPVFAEVVNGQRQIHCADLPARCIEKGKFGPSVVSHLITSKLIDHMPLHRTRLQFARECNLILPQTTIESAFARGCFWLDAVAAALRQRVNAASYRQMDESTIRVMIEPTKGKSHQGYMWVQLAPTERIVTFDYNGSRSGKMIDTLVPSNWQGVLQSDGYDEYRRFVTRREGIVHANCWAHGRRKFDAALTNDRPRAEVALLEFRKLFDIEQDALTRAEKENIPLVDIRQLLRKDHSLPIVENLFAWLQKQVVEILPKSAIGKAILYMIDRKKEMMAFLDDGRIELSTNMIENKIRPLALGRKNYLFAGSEQGAKNLAAGYSVIGTCFLNEINPTHYISALLKELPRRTANDINDLLPMFWKPREPK